MTNHTHTGKNLIRIPGIGAGATIAALLVFTACGSVRDAEAEPQAESVESAKNDSVKDIDASEGDALEQSSDGYTMQARFYWVPDAPDEQPTEARFMMRAPTDENSYFTQGLDYDVLPSISAGDYYQHTFFMNDGDSISAKGFPHNPPNDGRIACLLIETEQEVVIDYRESEPGDDSASCYGYAPDVDHDYDPGMPPEDFPVPF